MPTPGHTPGHVSVIVQSDGLTYFLAGDTSYSEELLLARELDGVSPSRNVTLKTIDTIRTYVQSRPTVYLPSHDARSLERLEQRRTLDRLDGHASDHRGQDVQVADTSDVST